MYQNTLDDITAYIDFLRENGYPVTISCFDKVFEPCLATFILYELHPMPVCNYLKQNKSTIGVCLQNKRKLEAKSPQKPFYGCCYAGVEEFIIPVMHNGKMIICIHLTGFKGNLDLSQKRFHQAKQQYWLDNEFDIMYNSLSDKIPDYQTVNALTAPLGHMLVKLYEQCIEYGKITPLSDVYLKALNYIRDNYMYDITVSDIAQSTGYSVSYFEHIFRKSCGTSAGKYLNNLKFFKATEFLKNTDFSVSDIAARLGFCDANYFSTAFKKAYGVSPLGYRKNFNKDDTK